MKRQVEVRLYNDNSGTEEATLNLELKRNVLNPTQIQFLTMPNVIRFRFFEYGKPEKEGMPEPSINVTPWIFNGPVCSKKKLIEKGLYTPTSVYIKREFDGTEQVQSLEVEKRFFVDRDKRLIPLEKGDISKYMFFLRMGIMLPNKVGGKIKKRQRSAKYFGKISGD